MLSVLLGMWLGLGLLDHINLDFEELLARVLVIGQVPFVFVSTVYLFGSQTFYVFSLCSSF